MLLPVLQELLSARLEQTAEFRRQADALRAAASSLEAQISEDAEQVRAVAGLGGEGLFFSNASLVSSAAAVTLQVGRMPEGWHDAADE